MSEAASASGQCLHRKSVLSMAAITELTILPGLAINPVIALIVVFQLAMFVLFLWKTLWPLRAQRKAIEIQIAAGSGKRPQSDERRARDWPPELLDAWRRTHPEGADREVTEASEAFDPERLLPAKYNGRLDLAAPGMFTGFGILGTFFGLIQAFGKIDPTQSASSIQPLIGGMNVAFQNSLVGVFLALLWTYSSRNQRHAFEVACRRLVRILEASQGRRTPGDQVLAALGALQSSMTSSTAMLADEARALQGATSRSSNELLDRLVPTLEQSFRSLVDMPFERLDASVAAYSVAVSDAARMQTEVVHSLSAAVALLSETKVELANTLEVVGAHITQFDQALGRWAAQADSATEIVAQTRSAAESLTGTANTIRSVGERHGQLASALGGAVTELRATGGAINNASANFDAASTRLETAAGRIESLSTSAAEDTARVARDELQRAIGEMAGALQRFGIDTAASFEASTGRVIGAVDTRMSDLTDRLSAELTTLSARLPEAMEQLADATREVRMHVKSAVRSLDEAVRQLDAGTRQSLQAQLTEYDKALASAVERFSGTLSMWDGKVSDLASASADMRAAIEHGKTQINDNATSLSLTPPIPSVAS